MAARELASSAIKNGERIITDLHDCQINGRIIWESDFAWTVSLGDELNGWKGEETFDRFSEAVEWLRAEAVRRYPDSEFAKKYGRGFY